MINIIANINEEFGIGCKLHLIKMEGYDRKKYYDETGLLWIMPSPNFPSVNTAIVYNATCIFEGTNVSEGRGTTAPFEFVGAPYIDPKSLADKLNSLCLPSVYFRRQYFTPTFSKHEKVVCGGVQVHVLDRDGFLPVHTGWAMLKVIRDMYPNDFKILPPYKEGNHCMLQFNTGCQYIMDDLYPLEKQFEIIDEDTEKFKMTRKKYLLY